jgi:hypothetical protein
MVGTTTAPTSPAAAATTTAASSTASTTTAATGFFFIKRVLFFGTNVFIYAGSRTSCVSCRESTRTYYLGVSFRY